MHAPLSLAWTSCFASSASLGSVISFFSSDQAGYSIADAPVLFPLLDGILVALWRRRQGQVNERRGPSGSTHRGCCLKLNQRRESPGVARRRCSELVKSARDGYRLDRFVVERSTNDRSRSGNRLTVKDRRRCVSLRILPIAEGPLTSFRTSLALLTSQPRLDIFSSCALSWSPQAVLTARSSL